jgi:hypothetical protein
LYELREKFDQEYFNTYDGASNSSTEILSLSYFYNSILRAVSGSVDSFWTTYNRFTALNTNDTLYWDKADPYYDMKYYTDYIIGESWMGNVDWPQNNIKIYRSNKTNNRYRFCIIDQELAMNPYAWTDCTFDHIAYMLGQSTSNPYINILLQSLQNERFHNYFINRFADLMNTSFDTMRLKSINSYLYNQTVTEMANEYTRWGGPKVPAQLAQFASDSHTFERELVCRTAQVRNHIKNNFNLPKQVDITLAVYPAGAGKIHISSITPTTYPWTGVYFDGVPVKIEALANAGYYFSHWGNNAQLADTLNRTFLDTLNSALTFKAYFLALPNFLPTVSEVDANFSVYPSPAEDQITILSQNLAVVPDAQYEIENSSGQLMQKGDLAKFAQTTSISIANFPKGIYFISIRNKYSYSKHLKFVKM